MYENTEGFGSDRFCGILVGGECGDAPTLNNWTVSIPDSKPPVETPQMPPEVRVVKSHKSNESEDFMTLLFPGDN